MAVTGEFRIPEQPADGGGTDELTGNTTFIPLLGDGVLAPQMMWEVSCALAGDASGGNSTITVRFDQRFRSICTLAQMTKTSAVGAIEALWELSPANNSPIYRVAQDVVPLTTLTGLNISLWNPPPLMNMDRISTIIPNVTGDTHILNLMIYSFDINVLQLSPLWRILANLPRSGLIDGN